MSFTPVVRTASLRLIRNLLSDLVNSEYFTREFDELRDKVDFVLRCVCFESLYALCLRRKLRKRAKNKRKRHRKLLIAYRREDSIQFSSDLE